MQNGNDEVAAAITALERFSGPAGLTNRISDLEFNLRGRDGTLVTQLLSEGGVEEQSLVGALVVKALAGQINVAVHALGILMALPVLPEEGEVVEYVSLSPITGNSPELITEIPHL